MSLFNITLSSLDLAFDPEIDECILYKILEGLMCMKDVGSAVSQFGIKLTNDLITLKRRLQSTKKQKSNTNESVGLRKSDGVDDTLSIPIGIDTGVFRQKA